LERVVFESAGPAPRVYIVADAYDGSKMEQALRDFFSAASGRLRNESHLGRAEDALRVEAGGRANLV
jgi:hypothetical protein